MDKEALNHWIDTNDNEIVEEIADNLECFSHLIDTVILCERLLESNNPAVRKTLAQKFATPVFILEELCSDRDPAVAKQAKMTVEEIKSTEGPVSTNGRTCDFYTKDESEVFMMISGPGVEICSECVEICSEIVQDHRKPNR